MMLTLYCTVLYKTKTVKLDDLSLDKVSGSELYPRNLNYGLRRGYKILLKFFYPQSLLKLD
jgi:hypothetical protein